VKAIVLRPYAPSVTDADAIETTGRAGAGGGVGVGVGVGGEDFARGDDDAGDLGEGRKFALAEPDAFLGRWIVADRFFRRAVDGTKFHCFLNLSYTDR
jgi:hypothetical protein